MLAWLGPHRSVAAHGHLLPLVPRAEIAVACNRGSADGGQAGSSSRAIRFGEPSRTVHERDQKTRWPRTAAVPLCLILGLRQPNSVKG
jgi:hypothetical protein